MVRGPTLRFFAGMFVGFVIAYLNQSFVTVPTRLDTECDCPLYVDTPIRIPREHDTSANHVVVQKEAPVELGADDANLIRGRLGTIRLLCWTMTSPENLETRAKHIQNTWARRCDTHIFISSETNASFPTVGLDVLEGRDHLTEKTMQGFEYVYNNHFDDADWFLKTDDDAYVIVENLRYFLSSQNQEEPIYFGHHFKTLFGQGYISGGPGIVISKEAMARFGQNGTSLNHCRGLHGTNGDVYFGLCMQKLGVRIGDSRDKFGKSRFHCFSPEAHLLGIYPQWYYTYDTNGAKWGKDSVSDYAIAFHYVSSEINTLEYLIYHVRPHGINYVHQDINQINVQQIEGNDDEHQATNQNNVVEVDGLDILDNVAKNDDTDLNYAKQTNRLDNVAKNDDTDLNYAKQTDRIDDGNRDININLKNLFQSEGIDDSHWDINENRLIERNGIDYVVEDEYMYANIADEDTHEYK